MTIQRTPRRLRKPLLLMKAVRKESQLSQTPVPKSSFWHLNHILFHKNMIFIHLMVPHVCLGVVRTPGLEPLIYHYVWYNGPYWCLPKKNNNTWIKLFPEMLGRRMRWLIVLNLRKHCSFNVALFCSVFHRVGEPLPPSWLQKVLFLIYSIMLLTCCQLSSLIGSCSTRCFLLVFHHFCSLLLQLSNALQTWNSKRWCNFQQQLHFSVWRHAILVLRSIQYLVSLFGIWIFTFYKASQAFLRDGGCLQFHGN